VVLGKKQGLVEGKAPEVAAALLWFTAVTETSREVLSMKIRCHQSVTICRGGHPLLLSK
jgi:hypothetical protein